MSRLGAVFREIRGRKVHVLGSGPDGLLPEPDEVLICVNLSATQPILGDREPVVTVIDFEGLAETGRDKIGRREFKNRLRGRGLGHLVVCQSNGSVGGPVGALGARLDSVTAIHNVKRNRLLRRVTGLKSVGFTPSLMPSTGITAVALAVAGGAASVRLSGFSLTQPQNATFHEHFYDVDGVDVQPVDGKQVIPSRQLASPRVHSSADALVVALIAASGFDIQSDDPCISALCHNWGMHPPGWATRTPRRATKRPSFRQYSNSLRWSLKALGNRGLRSNEGF